jgi:hypothetical protein
MGLLRGSAIPQTLDRTDQESAGSCRIRSVMRTVAAPGDHAAETLEESAFRVRRTADVGLTCPPRNASRRPLPPRRADRRPGTSRRTPRTTAASSSHRVRRIEMFRVLRSLAAEDPQVTCSLSFSPLRLRSTFGWPSLPSAGFDRVPAATTESRPLRDRNDLDAGRDRNACRQTVQQEPYRAGATRPSSSCVVDVFHAAIVANRRSTEHTEEAPYRPGIHPNLSLGSSVRQSPMCS